MGLLLKKIKHQPLASPPRVLEPSDRISEVLFGLIMVLTCTGSLSVAERARDREIFRPPALVALTIALGG